MSEPRLKKYKYTFCPNCKAKRRMYYVLKPEGCVLHSFMKCECGFFMVGNMTPMFSPPPNIIEDINRRGVDHFI